ncbi:MAG: hypothetical protein Q9168_006924 [Polycauliona sp. 1 TL-2023]
MDEAKHDKENVDPDPKAKKPPKSSKPRKAAKRREPQPTAICEPPSKSHLDRLPVELLHMICEELEDEDIPAVRLQCRYLCKTATPYFLTSTTVRFKKTSIDTLREISDHPEIRKNVEKIIYEPNVLEQYSRADWKENMPHRNHCDDSEIPPPPKQSASIREWRVFHRNVRKAVLRYEREPYSEEELDTAWPIYQRYLREQGDLCERDNACQDLCPAFSWFPNLKKVHVNFGWGLWHGDINVRPYRDGLCLASNGPRYAGETPGVKQMVSLVRMLDKLKTNLASLRIGSLNWTFFLECEPGPAGGRPFLSALKGVLQPLRAIEFAITTWSDAPNAFEDDTGFLADREVGRCRSYLDKGRLGQILAGAPDLQKLTISFDSHEITSNCPIDFQYIVLDTHWPHLHTVVLESIDTHEDDWIKFFQCHAATIRHIYLATIRLLDGTWPDVLERMHQLLRLDYARFHKDLYSEDPERLWTLDPPGCTSSKDDSVQQNRTRWALEKFMLQQEDSVCPLRDEVAHPAICLY